MHPKIEGETQPCCNLFWNSQTHIDWILYIFFWIINPYVQYNECMYRKFIPKILSLAFISMRLYATRAMCTQQFLLFQKKKRRRRKKRKKNKNIKNLLFFCEGWRLPSCYCTSSRRFVIVNRKYHKNKSHRKKRHDVIRTRLNACKQHKKWNILDDFLIHKIILTNKMLEWIIIWG